METNDFHFSPEKGLTFEQLPQAVAYLTREVQELKSMVQTNKNHTDNADRWFNVEGLCNYLPDKPAKQTVYGWITQRYIPYHKKGERL